MFTSQTRESIEWFFGVVCTVAVILALAHFVVEPITGGNRTPAAVGAVASPEKMKKLMSGEKALIHKLNKGSNPIEIFISAPGKSAVTAGSVLELEAVVEAKSDLQDLEFVWILPEGVKAQTGEVEGKIGTLTASQTTLLRLSLVSETAENRRVHLHVFRKVNGEAMGKMAQYNTVDQEKIEATLTSKAEMLKQAEEQSGHVEKIMQ